MVAYNLFRRGLIERETWVHLSKTFRNWWLKTRADKRTKSRMKKGGPDYYVLRRHRIGTALIMLVQRMLAGGSLTTTKAGKILGVKAKNVQTLFDLPVSGGTTRSK